MLIPPVGINLSENLELDSSFLEGNLDLLFFFFFSFCYFTNCKLILGLMKERFAHGELPDDSSNPLAPVPRSLREEDADMIEAAKSKMYGKLTRRITDWSPSSLLCKRMNIAELLDRFVFNYFCIY